MTLSEVALGDARELTAAHYEAAEFAGPQAQGKASAGGGAPWHTKGVGRFSPAVEEHETIDGDVTVPVGRLKPDPSYKGSLLYNEFIVYDPAQVRMRYLVKLKFVPNHL